MLRKELAKSAELMKIYVSKSLMFKKNIFSIWNNYLFQNAIINYIQRRKIERTKKSTFLSNITVIIVWIVWAYAPYESYAPLYICLLMKLKIVRFCPWWKKLSREAQGACVKTSLPLVIRLYSAPHSCMLCPRGRIILRGNRKILRNLTWLKCVYHP